ncbi:MAG: phosphoadenylyl-sulfate reductase [Thermoguttaceae bacterium]|nr:phosphoadenylyl-sulfate reductase [Thermoguttaceae bacterium]MDW8038452.1 phosphoadenylyl-sulfate reductase [Thermoguttaceae bacterium]
MKHKDTDLALLQVLSRRPQRHSGQGHPEEAEPLGLPSSAEVALGGKSLKFGSTPYILTPEAYRCNPPSQEELAILAEESRKLEDATPEQIIQWAVDHYFPKLTMATAFGPEGCLMLSMLAKIEPRTYVFNIDTGYQFPETLELRDRIAERYGIVVDLQRPELSVEEYEALHGGPVYKTDPDRCCRDRKIAVVRRVIGGYAAWMCGLRRDQTANRAQIPIVGWDYKFGLVKINPLARWTSRQVWQRIAQEKIPYNPLHERGYTSIGCWPCTRPIKAGEDERAGRWPGMCKTECGLHVVEDGRPTAA